MTSKHPRPCANGRTYSGTHASLTHPKPKALEMPRLVCKLGTKIHLDK